MKAHPHLNVHQTRMKADPHAYTPDHTLFFPPTLKMPPFCQAIFSMVSPRIWVWSNPNEETPQTHGLLHSVTTATERER